MTHRGSRFKVLGIREIPILILFKFENSQDFGIELDFREMRGFCKCLKKIQTGSGIFGDGDSREKIEIFLSALQR